MMLNEICKVAECPKSVQSCIQKFILSNKNNDGRLNGLFITAVQILISSDRKTMLPQRWKDFVEELDIENISNESIAAEVLTELIDLKLVTFELLTFVILKLELCAEENITEIKKYLKTLRSDLVKEEIKNTNSPNNMNLMNFVNAIEFQMFDGEEYAELDDITKIVCIAGDFLEVTKGKYSLSDLLMIKTAMINIDLNPKAKVQLGKMIETIYSQDKLVNKMLSEVVLENLENQKEYLILAYLDKIMTLGHRDSYVISTIENILNRNGISAKKEDIIKDITNKYMKNELSVDINREIDCFEVIVNIIYEVRQYTKSI